MADAPSYKRPPPRVGADDLNAPEGDEPGQVGRYRLRGETDLVQHLTTLRDQIDKLLALLR